MGLRDIIRVNENSNNGMDLLEQNGFKRVKTISLDNGIEEIVYYSEELRAFSTVATRDGKQIDSQVEIVGPIYSANGNIENGKLHLTENIKTLLARLRRNEKLEFGDITNNTKLVAPKTAFSRADKRLLPGYFNDGVKLESLKILREICAEYPEISQALGEANLIALDGSLEIELIEGKTIRRGQEVEQDVQVLV